MWAIKERISGLLIIIIFMAILFTPARGYCVILKGNLAKPDTSQTPLSKVLVLLYDWDTVKQQGMFYGPPISVPPVIGITGTSVEGRNFEVNLKSSISVDKEYVLIFSTIRLQRSIPYPSFIYGAYNEADYSDPSKYSKQTKWWNLDNIPKIKFPSTSGTFDLGTFNPPSSGSGEGIFLFGFIRDKNNALLPDVGIDLYIDQNGVPTSIPYPFYRFVRTDTEADSLGRNFQMGGVLKNTPYYIKLIANNKGYLDTFIKETGSDEPMQFTFSDSKVLKVVNDTTTYKLTDQGATISGYIRDKNNTAVTKSVITIQAISDNENEPFALLYVHDPNYDRFDDLSDAEKYVNGFDRYYFNPTAGKYEIKGLPFTDHEYYLIATELPPESGSKKYATPVVYDGVFNINNAKKIPPSGVPFGAGTTYTANFNLNDGACIEGDINLEAEMSDEVKTLLNFTDPNIFSQEKLSLIVEAFQVEDGILSSLPVGQTSREGIGIYRLCGLPPLDYIIRSYGAYGLYPVEYYDNQPTYITGEVIPLEFGSNVSDYNIDLSLGGMLKGRVLDSNGQPLSNASVFVNQINAGNPLIGYFFINSEGAFLAQYPSQTDPNGIFYVWGLPEGLYSIFVNGVLEDEDTGYFPQFYTTDSSNPTMIANQAPPVFITDNNPDFMTLDDFKLIKSGTGAGGGIISGSISLDSGVSSLVTLSSSKFYMRLFAADTGIEISNPLYQIEDPVGSELPYSIMIPDNGNYILSVLDTEAKLLPHYYRSGGGGATVNLSEASPLQISQGSALLKDKDVILSKRSGTLSGEAVDPNGNGISGLYVYASQKIKEGPEKGSWKSVRQAETNSDGEFTLKGLYKGTYIFSVSDPKFVYAPMYYSTSQDPYTPDDAFTWNYDPDLSSPPYITFDLEKGGRIAGSVGSQFAGTKVYAYRMKDGNPVAGFSDDADPDYSIPGLIPGEYILGFKDPNLNYLPVYYTQSGFTTDYDQVNPADITVGINITIWIDEMSFTQSAAEVEGQIKEDTGTALEPMLNTYIFLYRMSDQKEFWATTPAQFTATDSNGNYSLKGLSTGNYKIITFGPQYRPISRLLTIETSDLGSVKQGVDLTFPSDWLNDKYDQKLELEKGLNLIGYPTRIPPYVTGYTALSLLKDIVMVDGHEAMSLRTFSTYDQKWKSAFFDNTLLDGIQITGVHGSNFYVSNGQGFLLYSQEGPTINFRYFPGQTALWLKKGINLVGNVSYDKDLSDINDTGFAPDTDFTTRKMLTKMGKDASISIQTLDAKAGKWKATYWMWGKSSGAATQVKDEQGYIVSMKEDLNNWYPTNNN